MTLASAVATILILAGVRWMRTWLFERKGMPESAYRRSVLVRQALCDWRLLVVAFAPVLPMLVAPRLTGWESLGALEPARWVALVAAAVLAWTFSAYERNAFLRQTHALDRMLTLVLAASVVLHPAAAGPLAVHVGVIARQFEHPKCFGYSQAPIRLPMDLIMAIALWPAATLLCHPSPALLVVLLLAVAGAQYFAAGLAKALIGPTPWWWALHDRPHYLMAAAVGQGWLGLPSKPSVLAGMRLLRLMDRPGAIGAITLEMASLALLVDRRLAIALLLSKIGMHAGILLVSGLNFWKWAITDLALICLLATMPESAANEVFTPGHAALAALIVATQGLHLRCVHFGWLNTRWTSTFAFEAVGESGAVYVLPNAAFAPYDVTFGQHRHYHLCAGPVVVATYSSIGRGKGVARKWREIDAAGGVPEEMNRLRARYGRREHNEITSLHLDRFVIATFGEFNHALSRSGPHPHGWWRRFTAPHHILTAGGVNGYRGQERISSIRIWHRENWYDGRAIRPLSSELVREVPVDRSLGQPVSPISEPALVGAAA